MNYWLASLVNEDTSRHFSCLDSEIFSLTGTEQQLSTTTRRQRRDNVAPELSYAETRIVRG